MFTLSTFLAKTSSLKDLDIFFLTYDEPLKEDRWAKVVKKIPSAQWVDGVRGFDSAHKECAKRSKGRRFIVIDGDNELTSSFFSEKVSRELLEKDFVLSWSSINSVNSLEYGNGGIKCWDKNVALKMKTHESSENSRAASDFCFEIPYFQISKSLSVTHVNLTPQQAFRAGFREGVKMSLKKGEVLSESDIASGLKDGLPANNFFRLMTWMSVGADVKNGIWAIYGSRCGFAEVLKRKFSLSSLQDHEWFESYWSELISLKHRGDSMSCSVTNYNWSYESVYKEAIRLGGVVKEISQIDVPLYSSPQSIRFKRQINNPKRSGLMFKEGDRV